jgi:hypothetical protein
LTQGQISREGGSRFIGCFEVDFQARFPSGEENLIQVCADAGAHTVERELRALEEAGRQSPRTRKILLTLTRDGLPSRIPDDVAALPAYVRLLKSPESP